MLNRPFDQIDSTDLELLVANGVSERRDLEFKRDLPSEDSDGVKEFLADVTSLANAQGGDLIYGIDAADGVATKLAGLQVPSQDKALQRLENLLRDTIDPRLSGVRMEWISIDSDRGGAIVIRVPASLAAPHRVRYRKSGLFYGRNSRGKYEMDAHELRTAFTQSELLPQRIRQLHVNAVKAAGGLDMPFALNAEPAAVVSTIPLSFFREFRDLDVSPERALAPVAVSGGMNFFLTIEGIMTHTPISSDNAVRSYALTHRTGRTDVAWTIGGLREGHGEKKLYVWPHRFERGLLDAAGSTASRLTTFGIEGPWVILVTIIGARGCQMIVGDGYTSMPAWRDDVPFRELVLEQISTETVMPLLKSFWLLFGLQRPENRPV